MKIIIDIEKDITRNENKLSIPDLLVYKIVEKCCEETLSCDYTNMEMCKMLNLTFPTIQKSIQSLHGSGMISIEYTREIKTKRLITCKKQAE